jgi:hypothetical protein
MKIIEEPLYKEEFRHLIEYEGVEYIREEVIMDNDFHTISWYLSEDGDEEVLEYYSKGSGWSKDDILNVNNPIPEIEQIFQEKYGIESNRKSYHYE